MSQESQQHSDGMRTDTTGCVCYVGRRMRGRGGGGLMAGGQIKLKLCMSLVVYIAM